MKREFIDINFKINPHVFIEAFNSRKPVHGLTHNFYRYPARFSPIFVREVIKAFTAPGDLVLDPFVGGGTTLVEALNLRRNAIGTDISSLATFITRVKTTILSDDDIFAIKCWLGSLEYNDLNIRNKVIRETKWIRNGYQKNINNKVTWRIRNIIELILMHINELPKKKQKQFVRCALLKTAQWAFDCRKEIPSVKDFRKIFFLNLNEMIEGILSLRENVVNNSGRKRRIKPISLCLCRSAAGIEQEEKIVSLRSPKLVFTSPPYPGVHMLYHRWQVQGRRETPAPFWIANCFDGNRSSYYCFGERKQKDLKNYFNQLLLTYSSVVKLLDQESLVVQMVSFSDPSWQLQQFLEIMERLGLKEVYIKNIMDSTDGRIWREVPNRKWYADQKGPISSSKEVVLFHRLAK